MAAGALRLSVSAWIDAHTVAVAGIIVVAVGESITDAVELVRPAGASRRRRDLLKQFPHAEHKPGDYGVHDRFGRSQHSRARGIVQFDDCSLRIGDNDERRPGRQIRCNLVVDVATNIVG